MGNYQITLSIVSHDQIDLVETLISSIETRFYRNIIIILTLNTPNERFCTKNYPGLDIQIIRNEIALGFGENHNNAKAQCSTRHFIVCNPDIDFMSLDFKWKSKNDIQVHGVLDIMQKEMETYIQPMV